MTNETCKEIFRYLDAFSLGEKGWENQDKTMCKHRILEKVMNRYSSRTEQVALRVQLQQGRFQIRVKNTIRADKQWNNLPKEAGDSSQDASIWVGLVIHKKAKSHHNRGGRTKWTSTDLFHHAVYADSGEQQHTAISPAHGDTQESQHQWPHPISPAYKC